MLKIAGLSTHQHFDSLSTTDFIDEWAWEKCKPIHDCSETLPLTNKVERVERPKAARGTDNFRPAGGPRSGKTRLTAYVGCAITKPAMLGTLWTHLRKTHHDSRKELDLSSTYTTSTYSVYIRVLLLSIYVYINCSFSRLLAWISPPVSDQCASPRQSYFCQIAPSAALANNSRLCQHSHDL